MGFDVGDLSELEDAPPAQRAQVVSAQLPHMSAPRFDWYGATIPYLGHDEVVALVLRAGSGLFVSPKQKSELKGLHYSKWITLGDEHGPCAQVHWDGRTNNPYVRLDIWGPRTQTIMEALRRQHSHYVTRVDVSCDTEDPDAFVVWMDFLEQFVSGYPRTIVTELRKRTKGGENAQTFYVGSESSETRLCLYEKGKLKGFEDTPHLVRVELRICPESPERRELGARLSAEEFWGWAAWSTLLAPFILCSHVPRCALSTKHGKSTGEHKADSLARSYGRHLPAFFKMAGGAEKFGPWLEDLYHRQQSAKTTNRGGKTRTATEG